MSTMTRQQGIFCEVTHLGGRQAYHGNTVFNSLCLKQLQNYMLHWCKEKNIIRKAVKHESERFTSDPKMAKDCWSVYLLLVWHAITIGIHNWHIFVKKWERNIQLPRLVGIGKVQFVQMSKRKKTDRETMADRCRIAMCLTYCVCALEVQVHSCHVSCLTTHPIKQ